MPSGLWIILQGFCSIVSIVALSTIAREVTQSICLPIDEWIMKTWHTLTMEFYLSVKANEILKFTSR